MKDTAQNPDEQSSNHVDNSHIVEGDIVHPKRRRKRDAGESVEGVPTILDEDEANIIRQWDYHVIPYIVIFSIALSPLHYLVFFM